MEIVNTRVVRTVTRGKGLFPQHAVVKDEKYVRKGLFGIFEPGVITPVTFTQDRKEAHTWEDITKLREWCQRNGYQINQ